MTRTTTITEALAELKVITKRIDTRQRFVTTHLTRDEDRKDPLSRDAEGGAPEVLRREMQGITDLREQAVAIRRAITKANAATEITVGTKTRTVADWLVWRRDVMPGERAFLQALTATVERARQEASRKQGSLVSASASSGNNKPGDIVVNLSEKQLSDQYEELVALIEMLDGQLSLKNATITVEY